MAPDSNEAPRFFDERAYRRKACDLCFTKKIKCDMLLPMCTNCKLYNTACQTSIHRSKVSSLKAKASVRNQNESQLSGAGSVESRLSNMEGQLQKIIQAMEPSPNEPPGMLETAKPDPRHSVSGEDLSLPAFANVIPCVEHYFATLNRVMPLFQQTSFMRLLNDWHSYSARQNRMTWAAVLTVAALGLRISTIGGTSDADDLAKIDLADGYILKAQSVIFELGTADDELLGIQVLLALALFFTCVNDLKKASSVTGLAVNLANRMQLHSGKLTRCFSADEAQQRSRVFWILYALDKTISFHTKSPPMQSEADIDIPLPAFMPSDNSGLIWTHNGDSQFNFFRMRLDLSHIEGKIFKLLYAPRALGIEGSERLRRISSLEAVLEQWYMRVPTAFRISHALTTLGANDQMQMTKLYHAYLWALISTHGIYSSKVDWIVTLSSFSRAAILDFASNVMGQKAADCLAYQASPSVRAWDLCVETSRGCMNLFHAAVRIQSSVMQCGSTYLSALVIVLANIVQFPWALLAPLDHQLCDTAMKLSRSLSESNAVWNSMFQSIRAAVDELYKSGEVAIEKTREQELITNCTVDGAKEVGEDMGTQDIRFGEFDGSDLVVGYVPGPFEAEEGLYLAWEASMDAS